MDLRDGRIQGKWGDVHEAPPNYEAAFSDDFYEDVVVGVQKMMSGGSDSVVAGGSGRRDLYRQRGREPLRASVGKNDLEIAMAQWARARYPRNPLSRCYYTSITECCAQSLIPYPQDIPIGEHFNGTGNHRARTRRGRPD